VFSSRAAISSNYKNVFSSRAAMVEVVQSKYCLFI